MSRSFLAAVRDAVSGQAHAVADLDIEGGDVSGAGARLNEEETSMSTSDKPAGGEQKPGISQAEHDAAVAAAVEAGRVEGARAANERIAAALGADGVRGDGTRMAAALDLAMRSPGMSGEDVAGFVGANVGGQAHASAYESRRSAAAGAAQPQGQKVAADGWNAAIGAANSRFGKDGV